MSAVVVTVTETTGNTITVTSDEVIITTNSVAIGDAGDIAFTPTGSISATNIQAAIAEVALESSGVASGITFTPVGTITATNLQDAMHQMADQKFVSAAAPATADANLQEGDLWYNTTDNKLMVYRNTTWEEITLDAQLSESSGTSEYTDVTLNGGYF
jgi:hypothetical protein